MVVLVLFYVSMKKKAYCLNASLFNIDFSNSPLLQFSAYSISKKHAKTIGDISLRQNVRTPLITAEGMQNLKKELDELWRVERPEVTKKVSWAASLGDRSENADYQYNKKRLREIDRRVRYLRKSIENLKVVEYRPEQEGKVFFGAWVDVENETGKQLTFRIVGYDEIFGRKDYISIDSPMARALLKKEVDDEAEVVTEAGSVTWYINKIRYVTE